MKHFKSKHGGAHLVHRQPVRMRASRSRGLLSTHSPLTRRIEHLRALTGAPEPSGTVS
jgi:Zn-dependent protease with chaperone function